MCTCNLSIDDAVEISSYFEEGIFEVNGFYVEVKQLTYQNNYSEKDDLLFLPVNYARGGHGSTPFTGTSHPEFRSALEKVISKRRAWCMYFPEHFNEELVVRGVARHFGLTVQVAGSDYQNRHYVISESDYPADYLDDLVDGVSWYATVYGASEDGLLYEIDGAELLRVDDSMFGSELSSFVNEYAKSL